MSAQVLTTPVRHSTARHPPRPVNTPMIRSIALLCLCSLTGCATGGTWRATAEAEARRAIANEASLDPSKYPTRAVAILPLAPPEGDTLAAPLGFALAEFLSSDLARTGRLQMVERARTDALLRELSLGTTQQVQETSAPRTGKLLGARRVTTGAIVRTGNSYTINLRVVDAATSEIIPVSNVALNLDNPMEAEQTAVLRLLEALGVQLTTAERDDMSRRATKLPSLPALLAFGRGALASAAGDTKSAERNYRDAAKLDPDFSLASEKLDDLRNDPSASADGSAVKRVVQGVGEQIIPSAPIRTAEAADAPASGVQRLVTLIIQLGIR